MKVIDNRTTGTKVRFDDLPIGDAYIDHNDTICIKTSDEYDSNNCIYYTADSDEWEAECECRNTEVRPIKITYTIEG